MNKLRNNMAVIATLTRRDIKIFLKDRANVFFSMLAPLIVLLLYVLFLKKTQVDGIKAMMDSYQLVIEDKLISSFLDGWLISGMLSVGCITVSLSANCIRVSDKTRGILNDMIVSPVSDYLVKISYYVFNFLVTVFIMTIVFFISLIYLGASGTWALTAGEVFAVYGTLLFSSLSATFFTSFITSFCKTEATLGALVGIMSAMVGFIVGAYIPLAMMPDGVQYVAALLPGAHSAGMMREFLMTGALNNIGDAVMIPAVVEGLKENYCLELNFFGKDITSGYMSLYIACTTLLFFALNMVVDRKKAIKGGKTRNKVNMTK